jgi:hypothetical protein
MIGPLKLRHDVGYDSTRHPWPGLADETRDSSQTFGKQRSHCVFVTLVLIAAISKHIGEV